MQTVNSISIATFPPIEVFDDETQVRPRQIRWDRDEFYRMDDLGFFAEKRVELIEGEIIEMAPMGSPHVTCVMILGLLLQEFFGSDFCVRTQGTLDLGADSQPQPDAAVVLGTFRDYAQAHPTTAVLLIEVSDSTLAIDRNVKASVYARGRISEYWIINLKNRCVEVYRKPIEDPNLGFIYSERTVFGENQSISPLAKPQSKIKVADMLP